MKSDQHTTTSHFARALRARRTSLGISQKDLAEKSGVSIITLNQIETGHRNGSIAVLDKLASAMNCKVEQLISEGRKMDQRNVEALRLEVLNNIKTARITCGMSVVDLAASSGVSPSYIYLLEAGKSVPTIDKLYLLTCALGISLHEIIPNYE